MRGDPSAWTTRRRNRSGEPSPAAPIDQVLRSVAASEAAARLRVGRLARELLHARAYRRLGFVRLSDYTRERLGISARSLESAARVAGALAELPEIRAAFERGELSWTRLRLLTAVATRDDEGRWLVVSRSVSVETLAATIDRRHELGDAARAESDDEDAIDGEPAVATRIACPSRVRALWRRACELASRLTGGAIATWQAAEAIAAEAIAGRPPGARLPGDAGAKGQRAMDPIVRRAATLPGLTARSPAFDPVDLDARLIDAVQALRTLEPRLGRLLRPLVEQRLYRELGFRSLEAYVRERVGISLRKAQALVRIDRTVRRTRPFADAYDAGTLSWVRTLALLPVVDDETAGEWLGRANAVTVRRLYDEVSWTLDRRDVLGGPASLAPPPAGSALMQIGAPRKASGAVPNFGTGALEVADTQVAFAGPASVVGLFNEALGMLGRRGEPRWRALERMLARVIADWEAEPSHRDPVFARDGWRCTVPGCSSRRNLHDHHVRFRSRGGGNQCGNRTTVCAAHHLHGIHGGTIHVTGEAPHALRWDLPLFSCIGDRYV
jgi:hypothetical protein